MKMAVIAEAIAYCEKTGNAALAAKLRALKKPGRKPCEGASPHIKRLAELWLDHKKRVDAGEDEGDVAADLMGDMPETTYWNLVALDGRDDVRRELKRRGVI